MPGNNDDHRRMIKRRKDQQKRGSCIYWTGSDTIPHFWGLRALDSKWEVYR
jgi:hypothetical protein